MTFGWALYLYNLIKLPHSITIHPSFACKISRITVVFFVFFFGFSSIVYFFKNILIIICCPLFYYAFNVDNQHKNILCLCVPKWWQSVCTYEQWTFWMQWFSNTCFAHKFNKLPLLWRNLLAIYAWKKQTKIIIEQQIQQMLHLKCTRTCAQRQCRHEMMKKIGSMPYWYHCSMVVDMDVVAFSMHFFQN